MKGSEFVAEGLGFRDYNSGFRVKGLVSRV